MRPLIAFAFFMLAGTAANAKGWIEGASTYNRYVGWACFPNSDQIVGIHIYASGVYIGGGNAPLTREFAVRDACGSTHSNHGFDITVQVPSNLIDGSVRDVEVFSIHQDGTAAKLDNSPVKIKFGDTRPLPPRPSKVGDIVGRDLNYSWAGPLNYFGHIGIWDGSNVIESIGNNNGDDTLKVRSWEQFNSSSPVWPTISPVTTEFLQNYCSQAVCTIGPAMMGSQHLGFTDITANVSAMAARRAYVSLLIGAGYTRLGTFTGTTQGTRRFAPENCSPFATNCIPPVVSVKAGRGTYRCETFVMHSYATTYISSGYANVNQSLIPSIFHNVNDRSAQWGRQIDYIMSPFRLIAPKFVYDNFKVWN